MAKRIVLFLTLAMALAIVVQAADLTGKWVAQVPGRDGNTREVTFTFKASGDTLTGSQSGAQGNEIPISEGKISGDTITFKVSMERGGNTITWNYTGTVSGNEIKMKRESAQGQPREFVAKKAN
jgi:hypothetical protein